jgi:16S rRNA pseudouridine516 synthase
VKLLRALANLGYGSRKEVQALFQDGRVTDAAGEVLYGDDEVHGWTSAAGGRKPGAAVRDLSIVRLDGEALDPAPGMLVALHKPVGYTCSTKDPGRVVYDLLPPRWRRRDPIVSPVGRLDRDTSGLLLLTDDGALLHRITSPKSHLPKVYEATLASDLRGDEAALFAAGTLMLEGETTPLRPAELEVVSPRLARLTLHEGRYHQVRRMFAAVGNHVAALHRVAVGGLGLDGLAAGEWRMLSEVDRALMFGR